MSDTTFCTRLNQLISQIKDHPHKEEILRLAFEQLSEDTDQEMQQVPN